MSLKRHTIKQSNILLGFNKLFFSINYKSIVKNMFNILIYFILIICFKFTANWYIATIVSENSITVSLILIYLLNIALLAKILSVRMNWNGLFFKRSKVLSWKQTLLRYFPILFFCTHSIIIGINKLLWNIQQTMSGFDAQFWANPTLVTIVVIFLIFNFAVLFETLFFITFLFDESVYLILNKSNKSKTNKTDSDNVSEFISQNTWTLEVINSKFVLFGFLILSIIFAMAASDQANYYFLDSSSFNFIFFLLSVLIATLFFSYITISLNKIIFKFFNVKYYIDYRNLQNIFCMFVGNNIVFLNAIYFAKYLKIALVYDPIDTNNPEMNIISEMMVLAGGIPYNHPINLMNMSFIYYFLISIGFAVITYIIFFHLNSTPCFLESKSKFKQKVTSFFKESTKHKNSEGIQFKIIEKLFSKQLRKRATVKKFIDFLFVYVIVIPFITSVFDLYLLVYDSIFGHSSYRSFVLRGQYLIGIYFLFLIIFIDILEVARKSHKIPLTSIIKRSTLNKYVKYLSIHYSIAASCHIAIIISWVYQLSKEYGGIVAPEEIKTLQILFLFLASEYALSNISQKAEDCLNKALEKGII